MAAGAGDSAELIGWGISPPVVLGDGAYGDITEFRSGLEDRGLTMCWTSRGGTSAYRENVQPERLEPKGTGRPPKPRDREAPSLLKQLALAAGPRAAVWVTRGEGTRGNMTSRCLALRVRPANIQLRNNANRGGEEIPVCWLLCEWPFTAAEPTKYWLSNLPADTDLADLVRLGKLCWRVEHAYRELKDALGLEHFGGRTYPGWHHHVTLFSVAHAFLTLERRRPQIRPAA